MKTQITPHLREGGKVAIWSEDGQFAAMYSFARLTIIDGRNHTHGHVRTFNQDSHATSTATIYRIVP